MVGGCPASGMDFNDYLYGNFPRAIVFILAATVFLLLVMFRSILLPLKTVVSTVLSVSAACEIWCLSSRTVTSVTILASHRKAS